MKRLTIGTLILLSLLTAGNVARANAPAGRYSVSNGLVTDTKTGLTWQQSFAANVAFANASTYCSSQGGAWRLPTVKELLTLYDYSYPTEYVYIDQNAFGTVTTSNAIFWSATALASDATQQWTVLFEQWVFNVEPGSVTGGDVASVRCVR